MREVIECPRCGEDCSHAYGTYKGYPFHIGCLPVTKSEKAEVDTILTEPEKRG